MRKVLVASLIVLALIGTTALPFLAGAGPIAFGHTWGGPGSEFATAVVADAGGNVTLAGLQQTSNTSMMQVFVARFGPNGQFAWSRVLPILQTAPPHLAAAPNGAVYLLANTSTPAHGSTGSGTTNRTIPSAFVARLSATGSVVFAENYSQIMAPKAIASDPSTGGFIVSGDAGDPFVFPPTDQTVVAAFNATGVLRWARDTPTGTGNPVAVAADSLGRVFVLMDRLNGNAGIAAFDASGNLIAQSTIGSFFTSFVMPTSLAISAAGPVVAGRTGNAVLLSQLTASLNVSWSTIAEGNGWGDFPNAVVALSDGSLAVLTQSFSFFNTTSASNLYHFTSTGTVVSGSSYVSPAESQGLGFGFALNAGAALANGGLAMTGWTLGVSPTKSVAVSVGESVPSVGWSPDGVSWSPLTVTPVAIALPFVNPATPVDNWSELAGEQAWYGETNLPASKLTVTTTSSQSSPASSVVTLAATVSGGRKPFTFNWSFGDGAFGGGSATPSHTYPGTGRYLAQVTVRDSGGLVGYGSTVVTVAGAPVILSLGLFPNGTAFAGSFVDFFASALDPDGGSVTSYTWAFGDGSVAVTGFNSVGHVYGVVGNYTMTLTVADSDQGLTTSASAPVHVVPRPDLPPIASFFWSPPQPTAGASATFFGFNSFDPDGFIVTWNWDFGDGSSRNPNASVVAHAFAVPGNYTVNLTVTDNAGLTGNASAVVRVVPDVPPVAAFVWSPAAPSVNQTVFFNAAFTCNFFCTSLSFDPDGYIVSYAWDFGDGSTSGGNGTGNATNGGPFPTHVYGSFGHFKVTLTVTDNAGLKASVSHTLFVNGVPTASFRPSESVGKVGTRVSFNASSSRDPDGDPLNFTWTFGDGSTGKGVTVSHVFASPGQYLVTLFVSDPYVSVATPLFFPVILPKSPTAVIAWTPVRPVAGQTSVVFNASISFDPDGPIVQYIWEFGDGVVGSGVTATHVYANAGTYTPELIVVDEDGLSNRDTQTIMVVAPSKGTVLAAGAETPVVGASVELISSGATALSLLTSADGSFSLGGLAPGTYAITIAKAGFTTLTGVLVWDGLHGNLGTFVLAPVGAQPGVLASLLGSLGGPGMVAAAVALACAATYLIQRRAAKRRRP